jgi:hypothetical protein
VLPARAALPVLMTFVLISAAPSPHTDVFSSHDLLTLRLRAPLNELFSNVQPDGESGATVAGTLSYSDGGAESTIDNVTIGVRGHTSLREGECTFPKLKLHLPPGPAVERSPFAGHRVLKIGTHCGEAAGDAVTSKYGRLANEHAPWREAFVYHLLETVQVPTLKARPARITYVYTDPRPSEAPNQHQPIVRNAFLVEDTDDAMRRLGGVRQFDEKTFTNARDKFAGVDTATIAFAEAMIGNFDWCLKMTPQDRYRCDARHPLWNVLAVVGADNRTRPVIYDFDVAGMVAGHHRWFKDVYPESFDSASTHAAVEVVGQLERTRTLFSRRDLDAVRAHFNRRKPDAQALVAAADLDASGKRRITEYLDAFFDTIGSDAAFYRPAVVAPNVTAYLDEAGTTAPCGARSRVPVGTVVSEPLERGAQRVRVQLLDTLWHWTSPDRCDAIHHEAVWIDASAISRDFPR